MRSSRKILQLVEDNLGAAGAHAVTKRWCVYVLLSETLDHRVLVIHTRFLMSNEEVVICSLYNLAASEVVQRAGYNTCGSRTTLDTGGQVIVLRSGRRYRFGAEFVPTARRTLPAGERDTQHRRAQPRRRERTGVAGFDGEGKIPIARLEGGGGHAATLA